MTIKTSKEAGKMKIARFVLKCVALGLLAGAAVCAVVAYWDKISECFCALLDKLEEKRASRCAQECADYVDYEDWEPVDNGEIL